MDDFSALHDVNLKRIRRVGIYLTGGGLLSVGAVGLLSELGGAEGSSRDLFGCGLAFLFVIGGLVLWIAAWFGLRPSSAYAAGGGLVFLGTLGLLYELSEGMPSATNLAGYIMGLVLIISGLLMCVGAFFHYRGGVWSLIGVICVMLAIGRTCVPLLMQLLYGRQMSTPVSFYSVTAVLWGVGCYCLVWGHMRHRRRKLTEPEP